MFSKVYLKVYSQYDKITFQFNGFTSNYKRGPIFPLYNINIFMYVIMQLRNCLFRGYYEKTVHTYIGLEALCWTI